MYDFSTRFIGMLGYHASLKTTLSGLALVKDISVTCFMRGGNIVDFICTVLGLQKNRLASELERGRDLTRELNELNDLLKNSKIRTRHLNQNKKFREFGTYRAVPVVTFRVSMINVYYRSLHVLIL